MNGISKKFDKKSRKSNEFGILESMSGNYNANKLQIIHKESGSKLGFVFRQNYCAIFWSKNVWIYRNCDVKCDVIVLNLVQHEM